MKKIHKSSEIDKKVTIGKHVKVWSNSQIREGVEIGDNTIIGRNVYIDKNVKIGKNVKIQNNALIYQICIIEDEVFIGPSVCLANDKHPRSTIKGVIKTEQDWKIGTITIKKGASLGAGTIVLPNITIGEYAMVGAGSLVVGDMPDHALFFGHPATHKGYVCKCGAIISRGQKKPKILLCENCIKNNGA